MTEVIGKNLVDTTLACKIRCPEDQSVGPRCGFAMGHGLFRGHNVWEMGSMNRESVDEAHIRSRFDRVCEPFDELQCDINVIGYELVCQRDYEMICQCGKPMH